MPVAGHQLQVDVSDVREVGELCVGQYHRVRVPPVRGVLAQVDGQGDEGERSMTAKVDSEKYRLLERSRQELENLLREAKASGDRTEITKVSKELLAVQRQISAALGR